MRFLDPTQTSLALIEECSGQIAPESHHQWYRDYVNTQSPRLAIDVDVAKVFLKPGARVLEIGALPLLLTLALSREGFAMVGVDLDPSRFQRTIDQQGLEVVACNVETEPLPFADDSFDALILNEVLEHLRINPVHALREARRVLKPGGMLLLSTPNMRSFDGIWNLVVRGRGFAIANEVYDEYAKLERLGHMGHVREYATGDVERLLQRVGFRVDDRVFRNRQGKRVPELICRMVPPLRRYVSYVATVQKQQGQPKATSSAGAAVSGRTG